MKGLDIFSKTEDDFKIKTLSGGTISIICFGIICFLAFSEFMYYLQVDRVDEIFVDEHSEQLLEVYLNISFPSVPCDIVNLDTLDASGETHMNIQKTVYKRRLEWGTEKPIGAYELHDDKFLVKVGNKEMDKKNLEILKKIKDPSYCGSCYGAEENKDQCCNTCDSVKEAYNKKGWALLASKKVEQCVIDIVKRIHKYAIKEGCNIHGYFLVPKVQGNFHFTPGKTLQNSGYQDYLRYEINHFNTSHIIHSLGFGTKYPGLRNPLDGVKKIIRQGNSGLFQYFVKVVPTVYDSNEKRIISNQFSVTQHFRPRNNRHFRVIPGLFIMYDVAPVMIHISEKGKSFFHFLTSLCSIVGGVFTMAGIIDRIVYSVSNNVKTK